MFFGLECAVLAVVIQTVLDRQQSVCRVTEAIYNNVLVSAVRSSLQPAEGAAGIGIMPHPAERPN